MPMQEYHSDEVQQYMNELTAHVIAESGIPLDRFHLGKILLRSFRNAPDFILHIDGGANQSETFESGLKRSVQCANAFRKMGLKTNDVIVLIGPNHIHLPIPIYAGLYIGVASYGIDVTLGVAELERTFATSLPKIIFCQNEKVDEIQKALKNINHHAVIVTFDHSDDFLTFSDLLKSGDDVPVADFKATDFNPETTMAMIIATSGSTGLPKAAVLSHKNWLNVMPYMWSVYNTFPTPFPMHFTISPLQWLSSSALFIYSPIIRFTRLQTSSPLTDEHFFKLVNKYKPSTTLGSPNFYLQFYKKSARDKWDCTCFERIFLGGSAVPSTLCDDIKAISPKTKVQVAYGMTETGGPVLHNINSVRDSIGTPLPCVQYRIIDPNTQEDIKEPNVPGELWMKSRSVFMGYYNNPEMTEQTLTKDGWVKSGDLVYRDERWNFFFVERLKLLLKYMNHQISPVEIEGVIIKHPGVYDVAVTGIPDERGDLPVACVVLHEGSDVTAQEIEDMVKGELTDSKQLRGGVIFMKELPMTPSFKVNRPKLSSMVREMKRY